MILHAMLCKPLPKTKQKIGLDLDLDLDLDIDLELIQHITRHTSHGIWLIWAYNEKERKKAL